MDSSDFKNPPKQDKKNLNTEELPPPDSIVTIPRYNGIISPPEYDPSLYDPSSGSGVYESALMTSTESENEVDIIGGMYNSKLADLATASTNMPDFKPGNHLDFKRFNLLKLNVYFRFLTIF